ncbi:DUF3040 domain-containing protein [Corynebacterium aquatimens]|uniref:Membrane protein n=1 Tax=Corynebacterium aquatimens TaxID=1190508 RepID=A0A931E0D4_9CORY|nr:DUF3040 domain-containing protein [Corynebacterium aquatimens]MBG6121973.1 putative membrane protein [Corynebacterium aquatimens]WJY65488.1 hypothetical protein CAQUA_03875 [Corynebacterium aquatimens]
MSLSEQEQQLLREIEESLLADDPKFGSTVSSTRVDQSPSTGHLSMRSAAIMMLGLLLLIGGVALAAQSTWFVILSIVGFILMFAGGVWALKAPAKDVEYRVTSSPTSTATQSKRGSRMEENFRRRFEQP